MRNNKVQGMPAGLLAFALGFVALSAPGWTAVDDPVPNQDCGTSSNHDTGGQAVCGEGSSGGVQWFAERAAERARDSQLGTNSGVVCKICWDGVQCARSSSAGAGSSSLNCTSDGTTWSCTSCFTGSYSVGCAKCPKQVSPK